MSKDKCKTGIFTIGKTGHVHRGNKNTAAVSSHTGIAGAVHSRFLLFRAAGKLPTYRLRKILSRLLYHRRWQKARKKNRNFGGIWECVISRVDVGIDPYKKAGDEFFAEALPVADKARRKKGSGPRSKPQRGWNTAAATRANARRHYRAAARTRAPKQSTGLFFSLRSCPVRASARNHSKNKNTTLSGGVLFLERATRLELATSTLARSRSTR